jgi:hypothetical protein
MEHFNMFAVGMPSTTTQISSGDKGDITVSGNGNSWSITRLAAVAGSTTTRQLLEYGSSSAPVWSTLILEKSLLVESPTSTEDLTIWHTPEKIQVTEVRGVIQGGSITSITINPKWDADRSAAGTALLNSLVVITGSTTGQICTLGTTASNIQPTADSYIWLETTAMAGSGTGTLHVSIKYKLIN